MTRALTLLSIPFHVFLLTTSIGTWHAFEVILLFLPFDVILLFTHFIVPNGEVGELLTTCWTIPGGLLTGMYVAQVRLPMAFEVEADNWFMIAGLCRIVWFFGMMLFTFSLMKPDASLKGGLFNHATATYALLEEMRAG